MNVRRTLVIVVVLALFALPVFAQENDTNTVTFNGFSISFSDELATNVNVAQVAGETTEGDAPFWLEIAHTQFSLYSTFPVPEGVIDPIASIRFYDTADFGGNEFVEAELAELKALLEAHPDLAGYLVSAQNLSEGTLPFMPLFPAAQVLRAKIEYVETDAVAGVRYITMYSQAAEPLTSRDLMVTFQGLSLDGTTYVMALMPLETTLFGDELPEDFDWDEFIEGLNDYINESAQLIDEAPAEAFSPALGLFDALVQSISLP